MDDNKRENDVVGDVGDEVLEDTSKMLDKPEDESLNEALDESLGETGELAENVKTHAEESAGELVVEAVELKDEGADELAVDEVVADELVVDEVVADEVAADELAVEAAAPKSKAAKDIIEYVDNEPDVTISAQLAEDVIDTSVKKPENNTAAKQQEKAQKKASQSKFSVWFKEIKAEFAKIIWPNKKELAKMTLTVIVTSLFFGGLIAGLDVVFNSAVGLLVDLL